MREEQRRKPNPVVEKLRKLKVEKMAIPSHGDRLSKQTFSAFNYRYIN